MNTATKHCPPANYRGFSIEHENNNTYSIWTRTGYVRGDFPTAATARAYIDTRSDAR